MSSNGTQVLWRYIDTLEQLIKHLPEDVEVPSVYVVSVQMARANLRDEFDAQTGGLHPAAVCGEDCSGCCDEWEWK